GTPFLDDAYTVFGEVIEGLNVIDSIAAVKTAPGDRPVEDVTMTMTIIEE
ncbi:MAG: peptidylprolyl isomerase, partial [Flavobacteriales bacterium]|nr:peptidylprolyl isomerase [Flavobacteriales bacterium]